MNKTDSRDEPREEAAQADVDWEDTALWLGVQDANDDKFVRPDSDFES